jgi:hypothetical protein
MSRYSLVVCGRTGRRTWNGSIRTAEAGRQVSGELPVGPLRSPRFQLKSSHTRSKTFTYIGSFRQTSGRTRNTSFCITHSISDRWKENTDSFFATRNSRGRSCIARLPFTASRLQNSSSYRDWRQITLKIPIAEARTDGADLRYRLG